MHADFDVGCSMFGVCFCASRSHISRPDEFADQSVSGVVRAGVAGHDAGDPDATAQERRARRGFWRRGYGKYLRRTNDERAGEIYDLAGRHFLRAHTGIVHPLRAQKHS